MKFSQNSITKNSAKSFLVLILFTVCSFSSYAQPTDKDKQEDFELYKSKRVSFMTEKLQLTSQEAQKFWPIYNEFDRMRGECHQKRRDLERDAKDNYDKLSESDFKRMNSEIVALYQKESDLVKRYNDKFLLVLPARKVILIGPSENEFRFKMIREYRQREKDNDQLKK